jgi:hypothetical protein
MIVRSIFQKELLSEVRLNSVMPPEQCSLSVIDYGHHIIFMLSVGLMLKTTYERKHCASFAEYEKRHSHVLQKEKKENPITEALHQKNLD